MCVDRSYIISRGMTHRIRKISQIGFFGKFVPFTCEYTFPPVSLKAQPYAAYACKQIYEAESAIFTTVNYEWQHPLPNGV